MTDHAEILRKKLDGAAEHTAKLRMARDKARYQRDKAKRELAEAQAAHAALQRELKTLRDAIVNVGRDVLELRDIMALRDGLRDSHHA